MLMAESLKVSFIFAYIIPGSSEEDIENLRLVYDHFLARFPLVFGYWKKYADWELALVDTVKSEAIYERGVAAVFNSVDLWVSFASFKIEYFSQDQDAIRALLERASESCGYDFLAHPLWDKYIEFEELRGHMDNVQALLERIIHIPLHQYARYFEKYTQISYLRPTSSLVPSEYLAQIEESVRASPTKTNEAGVEVQKTEQDFQIEIRAQIHELKTQIYTQTQAKVSQIWPFESQIKRPYFHVKPLDPKQLSAWTSYLKHTVQSGDEHDVYTLYERALVPCASYPEIWSAYSAYLESKDDIEGARGVYARAAIHIPETRPGIMLSSAALEERHGGLEAARAILESLIENRMFSSIFITSA